MNKTLEYIIQSVQFYEKKKKKKKKKKMPTEMKVVCLEKLLMFL